MKQILFIFSLLSISSIALAQNCKPSFSATTNSNLGVTVSRTSNIPSNPNSPYYTIDWGDGSSTNSWHGNGTHTYSTWGTYQIVYKCTILDSSNNNTLYCQDTAWRLISVGGCKPNFSLNKIGSFSVSLSITSPQPFPNIISNTPHYTIHWGDGSTNTAYSYLSSAHTYSKPGNYFVKLVCSVIDSSNNNTLYCKDSITRMYIQGGCGNANFSNSSHLGLQVNFYNSSSNVSNKTKTYLWAFGDGNTSTATSPSHIYNSAGTYNAMLITTWKTSPNNIYCIDTAKKSIVVSTTSSNKLYGSIVRADSLIAPINPTYKVWLIKYDSSTQILSAIDSVSVQTTNNSNHTPYQFTNKPVGRYRVKAAITNGSSSGTGYVPTYGQSFLLWNNADSTKHLGGHTNQNINMKQGTLTSGSGFIGGSVLQGANKNTANGISGMNVYIVDNNNKVVQHTQTNAAGWYSFNNIPVGSYKIYPENLGDMTTPAIAVISNTKSNLMDVSFERSSKHKTIKPKPTGIVNNTTTNTNYNIYPNPAKDVLYIERERGNNETAEITLTDLTGKVLFNTSTQKSKLTIETAEMPKGLYLLQINTEISNIIRKIAIQ